jgi:hypothetical protein
MPPLKMLPTYLPEGCKARIQALDDERRQLGEIKHCITQTIVAMVKKEAGEEVAESCKDELYNLTVENFKSQKETLIGKLSEVKDFKKQGIISMIDKLEMAVKAFEPVQAAWEEANPPLPRMRWNGEAGKRKTRRGSRSKRSTRRMRSRR